MNFSINCTQNDKEKENSKCHEMIGEKNGNKENENHSIQSPRNSNHLLIPSPIICINQKDEGSLGIKFHA